MRYYDSRLILGYLREFFVDAGLFKRVDCRRGFIEYYKLVLFLQASCDGYALPLTTGDVYSSKFFGEHCGESLRIGIGIEVDIGILNHLGKFAARI